MVAEPVSHYDEYDEHAYGERAYGERAYGERDGGFELHGEPRDEEPPHGGRRLIAIVVTVAVMLLFAGGVWLAYIQGTRHAGGSAQGAGAVPLLRADERPTKVKPEQPGGMPMPDENISLYNEKVAKAPVEKLLPPPEQPMPRPAPPPVKPQIIMPPPETSAPTGPPAVAPQTPAPPSAASRTAETPPAASREVQTASLPAGNEPAAGTVQVRLGSLRSPEAAREEWQRLKRTNADLLGNLRANAVSADLGEKGIWYRIMVGPLDEAGAERLCNEMKQRNHGCIVAR